MNKNHFLCVKRKKEDNKQHHMKRFLTFSPSINMLLLPKTAELKKNSTHRKESHSIFTTSHLAFYERWPFRYGIHFASLFHCLTLDKQLNRFLVLILLAFFSVTHPLYNISIFFSFFYTQLCDRSWICT